MTDVQENVQNDEHVVEAKDKAPESEGIIHPLKSTRTWVFSMKDYDAAVASGAKSLPKDSSAENALERAEGDAGEPKVEKTGTTSTKTTWKFFTEGIVYTAGVAALHHFVYPTRVGSTAIISCALLAVLGIRLKHKTTNNVWTKVTYPAPKKMSPTDID